MYPVLLDEVAGVGLDDREGIGSEGRVFAYQPIHGGLKRAAHRAHVRVPLTARRGHVLSDLVGQRAPEARTGTTRLTPLDRLYRKVVCFNVFNFEFRGVHNRRHDNTPCPRMLPIEYGGCLLRSNQCRGTGAASREGQSSTTSL